LIRRKKGIKDIKASIDLMIASEKIDDWSWVDAIQMAMPVFAKLGVLYSDSNYFKRMYEMYAFTKYQHGGKGLYNPAEKLWWRDKDFVPPYIEPNGQDCYWSRGNGWVFAALTRVLNEIPQTETHRKEYLQDFRDMASALAAIQRADGFWNTSLHDPTHFGGKETTGTSLFTYGMAWGIRNGYLDKEKVFAHSYQSLERNVERCLHTNGFLGFVQALVRNRKIVSLQDTTMCPDFEDFGLGCFLLAGK
jgi:rhamnogalacturonyl hydrolase YesR